VSERKPYGVAQSALGLSVLTLVSPATGLLVESAIAWKFGTSAVVDAYRIGWLFCFLSQQFLIFYVLPNVIVPLFGEYSARGEDRQAWRAVASFANLLLVPTIAFAAIGYVWPLALANLLAPGVSGASAEASATFIRWLAPTLVLMVWSGLAAGILYARGIFWAAPVGSALGNVVMLLAIVLGPRSGPSSLVVGLVLSTLVLCALFIVRLGALAGRSRIRDLIAFDMSHPGVKIALSLALPLVGTMLLSQWVSIEINRVLSALPVGSLAVFGYAWRLCALVGLPAGALSAVVFPRLAVSWSAADGSEFPRVCAASLRMTLFMVLPLTAICFALRTPIVELLLMRGTFSPDNAKATVAVFAVLLVMVPASLAGQVIQKMLYAAQQMWIPACAQLGMAVLVTALAPYLAGVWGLAGVAGAWVVAQWLVAGATLLVVAWRYRAITLGEFVGMVAVLGPLAIVAALTGTTAGGLVAKLVQPGMQASLVLVALAGTISCAIYYGGALVLRIPEAQQGHRYLLWQRDVALARLHSPFPSQSGTS
jgi:putative peptidoglycan lipid II flippase